MLYILLIASVALIAARPQFGGFPGGGPPAGPPPGMSPVPPPIAAVLPKETLSQLEAIHRDMSLSELEKHKKIDQIMVNLPEDIQNKIPPPPGFNQLPQDVQQRLKQISRDKSLDFRGRYDAIRQVIEGLSPEHKKLLPPPPPPPPAFRGF